MKFIHTADLHIDSPLRGLEQLEGAPVERLRRATRTAFERIVDLALQEAIDFLVIAGDLFDGEWRDMQTGLFTARQFQRLHEADIPVYLIRGNHDAQSEVSRAMDRPPNVHEFSVDAPETVVLEDLGVALHGQGFAQRAVMEDLAAGYPAAIPGMFNLGLLHTSLTGAAGHDTYAPTNEHILVGKGYDYWALGHVHQRRVFREQPWIGYCGNPQGRHIQESGAKGCLLVSVDDERRSQVQFHATDSVRWQLSELTLAGSDTRETLSQRVVESFAKLREENPSRLAVVRFVVSGACELHHDLIRPAEREKVVAEIRQLAIESGDDVWVEKIRFETRPAIDEGEVQRRRTLWEELLGDGSLTADTPDVQISELTRGLQELAEFAPRELQEAGIDVADRQQLDRWLREANELLVSLLSEGET